MPSLPNESIVSEVIARLEDGRAKTVPQAARQMGWPEKRIPELRRWLSTMRVSALDIRQTKGHSIMIKAPTRDTVYDALPKPHSVLMRAAVFDIETTDFGTDGYEGMLLCVSVFPLDAKKPHTHRLEFADIDDRRLLTDAVADLAEYDILIGHYVLGFDLPWLASRLTYHRLPPLRRWFVADTCTWARALKLTTSKKLGNLIDYFRIPNTEKTAIQRTTWSYNRTKIEMEFNMALSDIVYHCETDVISNREVFNHLYPRVMSARYSSSSPLALFNMGSGVAHWYEGEEAAR